MFHIIYFNLAALLESQEESKVTTKGKTETTLPLTLQVSENKMS